MRLVFDTCALLRLTLELGKPFSRAWEDELDPSSCALSAASIYEVVWKNRAGNLQLGMSAEDYVACVRQLPMTILAVDDQTMEKAAKLEWVHGDPFDRMIVVLARAQQATLLTTDRRMAEIYPDTAW